MTAVGAASAAYIVAGLLFILSLAGLSRHETAKAGNTFGMAGMAIALVATIGLASRSISGLGIGLLVVAVVIGAAIGLWRARQVEMTGMPELIAILHSFVGLAAVLVGWNGYLSVEGAPAGEAEELGLPVVETSPAKHYASKLQALASSLSDERIEVAPPLVLDGGEAIKNHPDRLVAHGLPEEFMRIATDRLAAINTAWERIERMRALT